MTTDRFFSLLFKECRLSNEYFISFASCVTEFHCVTVLLIMHYLNPQELGRMVVALLRSKRIWHLVKSKSVSVPWQFAKHSGITR